MGTVTTIRQACTGRNGLNNNDRPPMAISFQYSSLPRQLGTRPSKNARRAGYICVHCYMATCEVPHAGRPPATPLTACHVGFSPWPADLRIANLRGLIKTVIPRCFHHLNSSSSLPRSPSLFPALTTRPNPTATSVPPRPSIVKMPHPDASTVCASRHVSAPACDPPSSPSPRSPSRRCPQGFSRYGRMLSIL
jgi:hypothetical protein